MVRRATVLNQGKVILRNYFIQYTLLRVLRRIVGRKKFIELNLEIYKVLQDILYFYTSLRTYCLFSGNPRSTAFGFVSRHKLKEYAGFGVLIGIKKTMM